MLKSKFRLQGPQEEEEEEEEEQMPEKASTIEQPGEEGPPTRNLARSEIAVRLSMLGKTANGDG